MRYLKTKRDHYIQYVEKHKTDRLVKNLKISTSSKEKFIKEFLSLKEEIFNLPNKTDYNIEENSQNKLLISFLTDSKTKYRLDIIIFNEPDKQNNPINHIAFSDYNIKKQSEYDTEMNKYEMIEVMNRIHFILKDLLSKRIINNSFCIGGTESLKKNSIYEYSLKVIVGDGGFDKLNTDLYDSNFGLYFKI